MFFKKKSLSEFETSKMSKIFCFCAVSANQWSFLRKICILQFAKEPPNIDLFYAYLATFEISTLHTFFLEKHCSIWFDP